MWRLKKLYYQAYKDRYIINITKNGYISKQL